MNICFFDEKWLNTFYISYSSTVLLVSFASSFTHVEVWCWSNRLQNKTIQNKVCFNPVSLHLTFSLHNSFWIEVIVKCCVSSRSNLSVIVHFDLDETQTLLLLLSLLKRLLKTIFFSWLYSAWGGGWVSSLFRFIDSFPEMLYSWAAFLIWKWRGKK